MSRVIKLLNTKDVLNFEGNIGEITSEGIAHIRNILLSYGLNPDDCIREIGPSEDYTSYSLLRSIPSINGKYNLIDYTLCLLYIKINKHLFKFLICEDKTKF